jgi:hypothetical protein
VGGWGRRAIGDELRRIEARGIGQPAEAARGEAGEPPLDAEVAAKLRGLVDEQANEFLADVSVADKSKIPDANGKPPV